MSLSAATTAYIAADVVYGLVRKRDGFPTYGRRGRLIEASLIAAVVMGWAWVVAPLLLDPFWTGVAGLAVYGLLFIPGFAALWLLKRPLFLPLGVGGLLFFVIALLLVGLNGFLPSTPSDAYSDALTIPLIAGNALAVVAGTYVATTLTDKRRNDQENERERSRIPSGPTFPSSTQITNTDGDLSPSSHEANDAVLAEDVSTDGMPGTHSSTGSSPSEAQLRNLTYDWQYSPQRFSDIGGYDNVKADLDRRVLEPLLAHRDGDDRFSRFGVEPESGIMLYGPPGTGKTLFSRALAGELTVPFVELSPADVTSLWVNESSDRVKTLFDEAKQLGPCIIFLDEAEHLFGARGYSGKGSHAEDGKVTSEFLAQLTREDREAIVVAATNRPGDIDPAILRPGRLAAHFEIGLPDKEARAAILRTHLTDVPSSLSDAEYANLATHTAGMTGADLADLVDEARRNAADRNARVLTREDFPATEDLLVIATELEPETAALPTTDDAENDEEIPQDPDVAVRSKADDDDGSDDSAIGYQ
ncbi:AAA family ATPase [Halorarius halobius]|uniref:AAA family ATPase n=1 Tax=Halorarius halobius TaxID=2962671 RepID=UPI0020CB8765|nr:AAA family ATPase [Halorarius halobius]